MEDVFGFKFSLDLSDFEKAPKVISDALETIKGRAEAQGKDADLAMAKYLQDMMQERKNALKALEEQLEKATAEYANVFANRLNGQATAEDVIKARDSVSNLQDAIRDLKGEIGSLEEAEEGLAEGRGFVTSMKVKAQSLNLYGKAMSMLPSPIAGVIKANAKLDASLKKLLSNPIVLAIAAVILAIKLLVDAYKGLFNYFDQLADRSDGVAYIFGLITGSIEKLANAIQELMMLNMDGFLYNLKTMFDGGEREVAKRNEDLRRAEEAGLRDRLQRDNQFLKKRINNTKLDMKDRLDAEKQFTDNLKQIEETRRAELQRKMTEWAKKNGYKTADNPEGWATQKSDLAGPLQVELQEMENEMARIDNAIADIDLESGDRRTKLNEEVHSLFEKNMQELETMMQKRKEFNRQVAEQMENERQRLKALAQQTENNVLQAQINEMADGIDKASKSAQLKTKQSIEQLNTALYNEAKQLYSNEKALFEANPDNEGKMFKQFNYKQYVEKAKKNIGFDQQMDIIGKTEVATIKKAVDTITQKAMDGATQVAEKVKETTKELMLSANEDAPTFKGTYERFTTGIKDATSATKEYKQAQDEVKSSFEKIISLQMEQSKLANEINKTDDPKEKVKLAEQIESITKQISEEETKGSKALEKQKSAGEKVKTSFDKIKSNASSMATAFTSAFSSLKGINDNLDQAVEAMDQMFELAQNVLNGDIMSSMTQVASFIAGKLVESIKAKKQMEEERIKREKESAKEIGLINSALTQGAIDYKLALLDAKDARDALYDTTNMQAMLDAQTKIAKAQQNYAEFSKQVMVRYGRYGQNTYYDLEAFVNSGLLDQKYNQARSDEEKKNINDIIKSSYNEYLFNRNSKGEWELNTSLWSSLKDNQDAIKLFTESQLNAINNIYAYQQAIDEAEQEYASSVAEWYSPLLDNMTDAMMNWLETNEDIMDTFKEYSGDTFRQILQDMLKNMLYKDMFKDYSTQIEELTKSYLENGNEQSYAEAIAQTTDQLAKDMNGAKDTYKRVWETWETEMNKVGIDLAESTSSSSEARGIARASQESVDENNARLAMMQQHTYSINLNVSQLVQTSSLMLQHLANISTNTARLAKIESSLSNIETYGIKTK